MPLRNPREWAWINGILPYYRSFNRLLPSNTRCKRCWAPFSGPFSVLHQFFLIRPSHKNPRLCTT
jgi:hypothetical protein